MRVERGLDEKLRGRRAMVAGEASAFSKRAKTAGERSETMATAAEEVSAN